MKAVVVPQYGEANPVTEVRNDWPKPTRPDGKSQLLVRVLACSFAAGDMHMVSGRLSFVFKPPSFPYVPGKDFCAIVLEADKGSQFKPGDCVVGSRDFAGHGGMAEYAVVREHNTSLKPPTVDILQAAACPDSAVTALRAIEAAAIKPNDRVLILGGAGGVGSAALQLAKLALPSYLATTSTQDALLRGLGADHVIDYRTADWWTVPEYQQTPFDVVIDCVGGNQHFGKSRQVLKSRRQGGRFVAVVGDTPKPVVKNIFQLLRFAFSMLAKPIWTRFVPSVPAYRQFVGESTAEYQRKVLALMAEGKLTIALAPESPFDFTAEGVAAALALQCSGHAHGKVVVKVADA